MKRKMAIQGSAMKRKQKENERAKQSARKPWTTYKYTHANSVASLHWQEDSLLVSATVFNTATNSINLGLPPLRWLQKATLLGLTRYTTLKCSTPPISLTPWLTCVLFSLVISFTWVSCFNNTFVAHCFGWKINYKQKHSCVEFCCILILHYITYIYKGHVVQHNMFWGFLSFTAMDFLIILVLGTRFFYPVQCKVVSLIAYGNFLHVLICSKREVKRFVDLTADETSDLWLTAQKVGKQLESYHKASSLTLAIQDGPQAGQMVPHVHIHLIPRKSGDFEKNDEIYDAIDEKEKELKQKLDLDKERKDRSLEDMSQEADEYRKLFL
ncbi:Bifunctional bis(5'-adenosyl)-triphosphatase/adenylylsulfatase FHIT [Glycine soja]